MVMCTDCPRLLAPQAKESMTRSRVAVERAARTLRGLDWFEVSDIRGHLVDNEIEHFQVTLKIGFRMEDPQQTRTA
jgi:flavin-binding protein dodecin